ncbi:hypothetical protein SVIOM342S_00755 [Streptomyces violaceorubidus]
MLDDTPQPRPEYDRTGLRTVRGEGQRDLALLPEFGAVGGQPISSRALPFVSFTNFSTKGMERAAKTV